MATENTPRVDSTRLQHLARAYTQSAVFYAAIDLGVFTEVSGGADSIPLIASATGMTDLNAERLVTVLLAMELLEFDDVGGDRRIVNAGRRREVLGEGNRPVCRIVDELHPSRGAGVVLDD